MRSCFLGFDLGSHASKGVLVTDNGKVLASTSVEHSTTLPHPGWQEQDPDIWWDEFKRISKILIEDSGIESKEIKAVGTTGFVPGLVLLDKNNDSIRPALMHTDIRAGSQLKYINTLLDSPISHGFLLPKLLWIKENEKENYAKIDKILVPHSFIVNKLTGNYSCDIDTATIFGGIYEEKSNTWNEKLCSSLNIDKNILPDLYGADSVVGTINKKASVDTGLYEGTAVIAGTGDTFPALLGCGCVMPGDMMIYLGTSGTQIFIDGALSSFTVGRHFGQGKAEFTGRIISCGDSLEHFKNLLGFTDWLLPDKKALEISPGSDGLFIFPHLKQKTENELSDKDSETIFGLDSRHRNWHIYRALLEGIAYNLKNSFALYESRVKRIILSGGGAKSKVFREIIRDVLGREVLYNSSGNGASGIAFLAGYGAGHGNSGISLQELTKSLSYAAIVSKPDSKLVSKYQNFYAIYKSLQIKIDTLYREQEAQYGKN
jgi:xylulokinase